MLTIKIKSYDGHFDTFACSFTQDDIEFDSLIPAAMLPYIAFDLCEKFAELLPYGLVGETFVLNLPKA